MIVIDRMHGSKAMANLDNAEEDSPTDELAWLRSLLAGIFAIEDITLGAAGGPAARVRGRFLIDSAAAYARLRSKCRARGYTLLFRRKGKDDLVLLAKAPAKPSPSNKWIPLLLAGATLASMMLSYALFWEASEFTWPAIARNLGRGWGFTLSFLGILVAHELGHYFTARRFGVAVTLPYLIPFPLSPFGTMGAMIRIKSIPPSRRSMLLIGAAGPLAGLAVGIPVLLYGLGLSQVSPLPAQGGYTMEGNSLLYAALKLLAFGRMLPSGGVDVLLHPVAFAGWAGLLVTSFNLIPAGQLDGGHIAYALLGVRARYLNWIVVSMLVVMGIWWQGWLLWAALVFVFSRVGLRPLDDVSPLAPAEIVVAVCLLLLFIATFTPVPLRQVM